MSVQTPAVFHAIAATGTMARALTVLIHPTFPRPILHELADEAMRQYRKTIRSLREYVDRALAAPVAIEPILLACLLCVCFEAFRGKKSAAMDHARLGWNIIQDQTTRAEMKDSPSMKFLGSIVPQHAGAYALFDDKEHHDSTCCPTLPDLSVTVFDSIEEATHHLNILAKQSEHFRTRLLQLARAHLARSTRGMTDSVEFCLSACLSRTIHISDSDRTRFEQLKLAHTQWKAAYSELNEMFSKSNIEDHLALQIRHFYSNFALSTCRDSQETPADLFMNEFKSAQDLIEQYLIIARRQALTLQRPEQPERSMFYGTSVLPTLHLIALKCRDPGLRRRALHMLATAHKQEGLEYSGSLSVYAKAAVEIEEQRADVLAQNSAVFGMTPAQTALPEIARIADCVTVGQGSLGVFRLICARYVDGSPPLGQRQIEVTQYEGGSVPLRLIDSWNVVV
jgi:hypothetical protein